VLLAHPLDRLPGFLGVTGATGASAWPPLLRDPLPLTLFW
jgi:hypothetical protein